MQLASVSDISERSREVLPRRILATVGRSAEAVLMTLFALIGWLIGALWWVCARSALSLEYGFRSAAGWPQRESDDDEPPPDS